MFAWLPRWLQPRWFRVRHARFEPEWNHFLERNYGYWQLLSEDDRDRLRYLIPRFVVGTRWEAARGFEVTTEVKVLIAAQACVLLLGLDLDDYPDVSSVIVHAKTVRLTGEHRAPVAGRVMSSGPRTLVGQAHYRGPVVLSWATVRREALRVTGSQNVVYHEFAHRLDMLNGVTDGTPPLDEEAAVRWNDVFTTVYETLRTEGSPVLRPYAGTNPAEFFAVATEAFFNRPVELRTHESDLYSELSHFYGQDPVLRIPAGVD